MSAQDIITNRLEGLDQEITRQEELVKEITKQRDSAQLLAEHRERNPKHEAELLSTIQALTIALELVPHCEHTDLIWDEISKALTDGRKVKR